MCVHTLENVYITMFPWLASSIQAHQKSVTYICMRVCMYVRVCICICIYIYIYIHMYTCIYRTCVYESPLCLFDLVHEISMQYLLKLRPRVCVCVCVCCVHTHTTTIFFVFFTFTFAQDSKCVCDIFLQVYLCEYSCTVYVFLSTKQYAHRSISAFCIDKAPFAYMFCSSHEKESASGMKKKNTACSIKFA